MAVFRPFRALRPLEKVAPRVAALPYDVMTSEEARDAVRGNPYSFLHVDKAEIDLPEGTGLYDDAVYAKARENLTRLKAEGVLVQDAVPCVYIYRQIMRGRAQTGLVGCAAIDDYLRNVIKKHEFTRADKEADRIRHVDACNANTGPIFLTYRARRDINTLVGEWENSHSPACDFTAAGGVRQTVWVVDDAAAVMQFQHAFSGVENLYIADGHHRAASAVQVGLSRRRENPAYTGREEFNFFLAVCFPSDQLAVMDYNRVVKDLGGRTEAEFMARVSKAFDIEALGTSGPFRPNRRHTFGMYLHDQWFCLTAKSGAFDESDPVARLDVSILQENLLGPILKIGDPRKDERIDFIGGIRGLGELERRVHTDMRVAFAMAPTTLDELMDIADAGAVMPPKSTWFEPKLLSGLFIHMLEDR